jgi:hypothetical protein
VDEELCAMSRKHFDAGALNSVLFAFLGAFLPLFGLKKSFLAGLIPEKR